MAPSIVDHTVAPPGYSSQRDSASPLQSISSPSNESADDLVSAQTHPHPHPPSISSVAPRHSDVRFDEGAPVVQRSRTAASRTRYASLPYAGSTVTFPMHLTYHSSDATSIIDVSERELELPALGSPSMQELHEKLASGPPVSRGPTIRLNPANYVFLSRKGAHKRFLALARTTSASIKGKFTVNPYLHVPAALLAPTPGRDRDRDGVEAVRKNLKFEVENGGINVEIFLVGEPDAGEDLELARGVGDADTAALRTTLDLKIRAGPGSTKNKYPLIAKIVSQAMLPSLTNVDIMHTAHPNHTPPALPPHYLRTRRLPLPPPPPLLPRSPHPKHQTHFPSQSRSQSSSPS